MSYSIQPASLPELPPADFLSARRLIPEADSQDVRNQRNHKQMGKYDFIPQESQVTGQYGEEQYNDSARGPSDLCYAAMPGPILLWRIFRNNGP